MSRKECIYSSEYAIMKLGFLPQSPHSDPHTYEIVYALVPRSHQDENNGSRLCGYLENVHILLI